MGWLLGPDPASPRPAGSARSPGQGSRGQRQPCRPPHPRTPQAGLRLSSRHSGLTHTALRGCVARGRPLTRSPSTYAGAPQTLCAGAGGGVDVRDRVPHPCTACGWLCTWPPVRGQARPQVRGTRGRCPAAHTSTPVLRPGTRWTGCPCPRGDGRDPSHSEARAHPCCGWGQGFQGPCPSPQGQRLPRASWGCARTSLFHGSSPQLSPGLSWATETICDKCFCVPGRSQPPWTPAAVVSSSLMSCGPAPRLGTGDVRNPLS